ncbi:Por secretion system C-terminal sorting domain-containing protein [Dyadobacter sp. SG02]|uniref:T9SS type A sorting domain-containing protein n=1 Tax=Dyadobacter sp. SG02 TaxID=1855291 RepID=UPI0008D82DD1|nr:T9SS type A sorting domain-containing protein [Dyadobacter sp. SG02]SEI82725.1 Por secretion system C-terminal sorting domain-containing protein [Dyadobacter sp. SG02]
MKRTFIKESFLTIFATVFCLAASFGQTSITTGTVSPSTACAGSDVSVPFTTAGTVLPTVTFHAQLSDAAGAFSATPVEIGNAATSPISATIPAGTTAGAGYKIRVVSKLAGVIAITGSESVAVTVNAVPAAPTVTSPVNYTQNAVASALSATPGTGGALNWYGTNETGGTGSSTAPTPATTAAGTTIYYVSQTVAGCESNRAKIDVIVAACTPPAKPTVTTPVTYTVGDAPAPLTVTAATGATINWYGTNASGGTASATAPTPSTATAGSTTYYVSQTVAACESERAQIVVNVNACTPPAAPTVVNKSYTVGDVAVPLTATGTGLKWYGTDATGGTASTTAPTPSTAAAGTTSYYVSQTVGGCESSRVQLVVTVNACTPPAAPTVSNKSYTVGDAAAQLTATGSNLKWYGTDATGGTASATAPTPSTTAPGITSYYVSQTVGGCESARAQIVVTVTACTPPAAPTVANKSYTVGDAAVPLTATGSNLKWYGTDATGGTASATAPTPSTAAPGTTSYYVSQTVGGCESARAQIVVTVNACTPPAAPTVANKSYTIGDAATPLTATGTNLKWYGTNATGGTGSATAPTPSTATPGTTSYYVSQTVGGCESARAQIVVTVNACIPPAAPGVSNISYCIGSAAAKLNATGSNLKWYTDATGGTGSATAPTPSTSEAGVKSYFVSQTVGACESARAEIKVTINETPAPTATSPIEYCLNEAASPLTATGTGLKWYMSSTGGTALTGTPTPVTTAAGTTRYYVSQTVNGCESQQRKEVAVVVKNPSTAPTVTATVNLCQNSSPAALTANGSRLKWYTSASGGTALDGAPVPVTTAVGTTNYYVSQTAEGLCEGPRAKIEVIIKDTPAAPAVTPVDYCVGAKPVALTPSGAAYKWYNGPTGGTGTTAPPTPTATTVGTTSYYVTQANTYGSLTCESPRAKLDVNVNATPGNVSALSQEFCQERGDKNYTFPTQAQPGNTLNWYTAATNGTPSTATPSINLKDAKETTFFVTQVSNKGCESATRVAQKVLVKPLPGQPGIAQSLIEYCQFIPAKPLEATAVTNASLNWFGTDATGGTSSPNAPTPSTAEGGTTSYYVAQTLAGCIGDRAKIDIKVNTTPKPVTKTFLEYCQNAVAPALDATGTVLKWYREANGVDWQGIPFIPFTAKVEDYSFYVTQTGSNGCESPKEEIKIHIKALPSATISGNSTIDLGQTATVNIRFTGDGPWIYALSNGLTDTTDQANHQVQVKPSTTTSYLLAEVSNACGKGTINGLAVVTVKVPTINSGNASVSEVCAGKAFNVPFQQSGDFPAGNTFKLQVSKENTDAKFYTIPSTATANSVSATFPDTTKGGTYFLRVISSGANPDFTVKGSVSSITINATPLPVATLTGTQTILVGETADLKAEITGKGPWTITLNNGTKDTLITANATPYTFKLAPKTTTTYAITKVTNGCGIGTGVGTARVQVDPILGVEPPAPADWAKVYPTVINGKCTVEVTGTISPKQAQIEVVDLNGRARSTQVIKQQKTEVDFANYPSGLYLLRIRNGNLTTVQRVMKP